MRLLSNFKAPLLRALTHWTSIEHITDCYRIIEKLEENESGLPVDVHYYLALRFLWREVHTVAGHALGQRGGDEFCRSRLSRDYDSSWKHILHLNEVITLYFQEKP
jgi:hypothetical protein